MKALWIGLLALALVAGCTQDKPAGSPPFGKEDMRGADGKVDSAIEAKMCEHFGLPVGCDLCEAAGWYGDGACETFCRTPDPDCAGQPHASETHLINISADTEGPFPHEEGVLGAKPEPVHVHLSYVGDPRTSMTFTWQTDEDTAAGQVWLRDSGGAQHVIDAPSMKFEDASGEGTWRIHEVTVEGLLPEATYTYQVGAPAALSDEFTFRTAPLLAGASFRFGALGDSREQPEIHGQQITSLMEAGAEFIVHTGDLVNIGVHQWQWDLLFGDWKAFAQVPFMPSLGNHERRAPNYYAQFALPETEEYYHFVYSNMLIISLNSDTRYKAERAGVVRDYLEETLAAYPDVTWRIVYHHQPIYSSGKYSGEEDLVEAWGPLYDEYHVDLVFTGHNHAYERTKPIRGGEVEEIDEDGVTNGTVYVVTGGAGAPLHEIGEGGWFTEVAAAEYHYCLLDVDDRVLDMTVYLLNGDILDSLRLSKR